MVVLRHVVSSFFLSLLCVVVLGAPNESVLGVMYSYDEKRVWLLLLMLLSSMGLLFSQREDLFYSFLSSLSFKIFLGGGLLCVAVSISCYNSEFTLMSILEAGSFLGLMSISFFVADTYRRKKNEVLRYLGFALIAASLWYFFSFVFIYFWGLALASSEGFSFDLLFHGFMNKRHLNQYQVWVLPLVTLFVVNAKPSRFKGLEEFCTQALNLSVAGIWLLLFVFSSRGAIASLIIAWLVIFIVMKQGSKRLLYKHVKVFLAGLAGAVVIIGVARYVTDKGENIVRAGLSGRGDIWREVIQLWSEAPFFGVGPMNFAHYSKLQFGHPHNAVLQIGLEFGAVALLALCLLFLFAVKAWFQARNDRELNTGERDIQATLMFSLLAAGIYSNVSGVIVMPLSQLMMAVVVGMLLGEYALMLKASVIAQSQVKGQFVQVIKSILAVAVIAFVLLAFYDLNERILWGAPDLRWSPRFWFEGRF